MAKTQLMELRKRFGRHVKHLREKRKMRQSDLAERLGITAPAVCYIEQGRNLPADRIKQIADIFEVTADSLFSDEVDNA